MERRIHISGSGGYSLVELLVVLVVLAICLALGTLLLANGVSAQEARGAAQSVQAGIAWAQIGVVWQGGATELTYLSGVLELSHDQGLCGGDLGRSAPAVRVTTNVGRWSAGDGVTVTFTGGLASPDGGGSLYFRALAGSYRLVVRPETGLTVRSRVENGP
jgi:prepilin-type N-terminal cleavage/methylation domain-containing protein